MEGNNAWNIVSGDGSIVATAIHSGHSLRPEISDLIALNKDERLREEDPFTDELASIVPNRIIGTRSRFEVDFNRPRDKAVYQTPSDAWGLNVWKTKIPAEATQNSLSIYDKFYREVGDFLESLISLHGRIVVFDIHSYNHRRDGPIESVADPDLNPEINVGTGTMYRRRWTNLIDRFLNDLRQFECNGRRFDARENVKFFGGQFPKWIHDKYPKNVCVLSIEFKKFFMDEWTGLKISESFNAIKEALASTIPGVKEELEKL